MKKLILCLTLSVFSAFAGGKLSADVELFPAGDFTATSSKVDGYLVKKGGKYYLGRPIKVPASSFETGVKLRDEHMAKYMSSKGKHPNIVVSKGMAAGGKGVVLVTMNGKSKKVPFTYDDKGSSIIASFKIKISDYVSETINYMGVGVEDEVPVKAVIPVKK